MKTKKILSVNLVNPVNLGPEINISLAWQSILRLIFAIDLWCQSLMLIFVVDLAIDTKIGFERPVQGTLGKPIDFKVFEISDFSTGSMDRSVYNWICL